MSVSESKPIPATLPFEKFVEWIDLATKNEINDPIAATLATVSPEGMPSARMILVKGFDAKGFVFYTCYEGRKGVHLEQNPKAALCFHWKSIRKQITVEGAVAKLTDTESDTYFSMRPRGSQITAWASQQSTPLLGGREELDERRKQIEARFEGHQVPRPANWGGYRLTPLRFEFWQDAAFRQYHRIVFSRASAQDDWKFEVLNP